MIEEEEIASDIPEMDRIEVKFDCYTFYKFIDGIENYIDEGVFRIKDNELYISFMDPSRVMLAKASKIIDISVDNEFKLVVDFGTLRDLLKTRKEDKKTVKLEFVRNSHTLNLTKKSKKYNSIITRELELLDIDPEEIPMDKLDTIEYTSRGTFPISFLNDFFYESGVISDVITIQINEEGITFNEKGVIGKSKYLIKAMYCETLEGNEQSDYSLTFLKAIKPLLSILSDDTPITLNLKQDNPLKINFSISELGIDIVIFHAPRIEEVEFEEDEDSEDF